MPCLSHLNGTYEYEQYTEQYINSRHRVNCCINYVLVFHLFAMILLVATPVIFFDISRKVILYKQSSETVYILHENKLQSIRLSSILLKECIEPIPVSLKLVLLFHINHSIIQLDTDNTTLLAITTLCLH